MFRSRKYHRGLWTAVALLLPLLYLQQLAPHQHAESVVDHDHHHAAPNHTHDHHHSDAGRDRAEAHHHHTLATHLDLHELPVVPAPPEAGGDAAAVAPSTARVLPAPDLGARPPADSDPPSPPPSASAAAPRGPPHRA